MALPGAATATFVIVETETQIQHSIFYYTISLTYKTLFFIFTSRKASSYQFNFASKIPVLLNNIFVANKVHNSECLSSIGRLKNIFIITMATGLAAIVVACAAKNSKPDFYPKPGTPYTMTYIDEGTGKEVTVFNLTGHWEGIGYESGIRRIKVKQNGRYFTGVMADDGPWVGKGKETIRGYIVEGNMIYCELNNNPYGWTGSFEKIDPSGNTFACLGHNKLQTYNRLMEINFWYYKFAVTSPYYDLTHPLNDEPFQ